MYNQIQELVETLALRIFIGGVSITLDLEEELSSSIACRVGELWNKIFVGRSQ
jgi:hypothetical protein